jgi:hypothetical protein
VDLAFCRFLFLHVIEPSAVVLDDGGGGPPGGWVVAQEPITSAGRIDGHGPSPCPTPSTPISARCSPLSSATPGSRSSTPGPRPRPGVGPGPGGRYLWSLTGVDPGDDPVVLPPLVTVIGRGT